ncbi:MAG TPA: tRNA 2-selenouridine(34) synthase MnmH, partial [Casimicrobiaceae bacterium]
GDFTTLVDELLVMHYDPTYGRSILRNFPRHAEATRVTPYAIDMPAFRALARDLDAQVSASFAVAA